MADFISVFVDGACRNNGQENPQGGCGVYWGEENQHNTSEFLLGEKQTNNRAELTAAIIALAQAKHHHVQNVQITTDSKYVKEGITKWIVSWKANSWKTKQKTDVLNKDLWLLIDCLSREINVNWCWVEGHGEVTGNIKADELAKSGISSESCYWQQLLKITESEVNSENKSARESRKSDIQQAKESRKNDVLPTKDFDCGICTEPVSDDGIQCGDCKLWFHYICSKLPSYQLYMYENSQRKYTCEKCSNIDDGFNRKYEKMVVMSRKAGKYQEQIRKEDGETQHTITSCCAEVGTQVVVKQKDNSNQTESRSMKDKSTQLDQENCKKTSLCTDKETQTLESLTTISKCLTEFQDGTIQRLESSFVNAVDNFAKVHNNTADLNCQIRKLTQERDTLKLQKQQATASTNQEIKKCSCLTLQAKVESLEKETDKLKRQCYTANMEKEIEVSKQRGAMTILKQKYESANTQVEILQQDVDTMEKRLKIKNDVIIDLEEQVKKQNAEMLKLHDEILSWKMHASRKDDDLLNISNREHKVTGVPSAESHIKARGEGKKTDGQTHQISSKHHEVIDVEKIEDKKKVLLLGTSNTKFINTSHLSNNNVEVEKRLKYKLNEAQEFIDTLKTDEKSYDAFVLHLLENDITEETPEHCSEKLHQICSNIKQKVKDSKVVVSMGLPREDETINRKVIKLNVLLQEKLGDMEYVHLCDNSNLFYRGQPSRGILNVDGKHLSRQGTQKLESNLKSAVYKALEVPTDNDGNRSNRFYGRRYGGPWRSRPRYGYRRYN